MGAETSVVMALFFLGFMMTSATIYASVDYSQNLVKSAQSDQGTMKKNKMQTDITITNIALNNITINDSQVNITIKNTGKTTLNASLLSVLVNGSLYNYSLLTDGDKVFPEKSMNITIFPVNYTNTTRSRFKAVTENGISDYAIVP